MTHHNLFKRGVLRGGTALTALAILGAGLSAPAFAQDAVDEPGTTAATDEGSPVPVTTATDSDEEEIVITGTLFRRTNTETPSPVTVLSAETLEQRGLNTVSDAVQRISAGNAGTITNGWNTGFNFASGANAVSLRGLTVQSTLSIFDGLRMAPYPLADDGQRNFVDLNTIPNAVIERIEVLRDGASSTYGADAVAGVVNVITKKEHQGIALNGSVGIDQRGDSPEYRIDGIVGYGDLDEQGFNVYLGGEYQRQDDLWARDRGFPYDTQDLQSVCGPTGSCMANHNWNGVTAEDGTFNGLISIPGVTLARPVPDDRVGPGTTGAGRFSYVNAAAGCRNWDTITIDPTQSGTSPLSTCEVNFQEAYIMLQPTIERWGLTGRITANLGPDHQFYAMGNYYNTDTSSSFTPIGFNGTPTPPTGGVAAYNVIAPVYVCPNAVGTVDGLNTGCTAENGTLNPYNPFAADGQRAHLFFRSNRPRTVETSARALRGVVGLSGTLFESWDYSVDFTASSVRLDRTQRNYYIPQRIMDVVARGEFNFADPDATPESVWDYIGPDQKTRSTSDLWQATATVAKELFQLPGGPLQVAGGVAYRHEAIDAPSANPQNDDAPYTRYYSINSVGTEGSRNVFSAFGEISAPIIDQLEVNLSGRYDDYSTGQNAFSPKIGVKYTPIPQLAVRGTWSKGFRIPSFNESFGLPTTGYVTRTVNCENYAAFCAAHGGNAYAANPFTLGLTQVGNPDLDPERSQSITFGAIFEPVRNLSFTVDLWRIKVKDLIVGVSDIGPVFDAYYSNNGNVNLPGFTIIPGVPDPAFPNALPHIGFIQTSYANADTQLVQGIDFGVNYRGELTPSVTWFSSAEGSFLHKNHLTLVDPATGESGDTLEYEGSLSPCNITSCSGSPRWRITWQNTFEFNERTTASVTAYYTSGYDMASVDFGATPGDCQSAIDFGSAIPYVDGNPQMCVSEDIWNIDFAASHEFTDNLTVYVNVMNVFDMEAPFDPGAAYSLFNYNPAWGGPNIMGRFFRLGVKAKF